MIRRRRILAIVVTFCMMIGLIVCPDGKEEVQAVVFGDYEYEVLGDVVGTIEITKYKGSNEVPLIPEIIDGMRVISIGDGAFRDCKDITEVTLPTGLISIGNYAFSGCSSLVNITLPSELTSIGEYSFSNCSNLVGVSFPIGLANMGSGAFYKCESLAEINLTPTGLTSLEPQTFQYCSNLVEISLPAGLTSIGRNTFWECKSLKKISFPMGMTSIGNSAFLDCTSLKEVSLPAELDSIGQQAFDGCTSLTGISLPDGLTSIEFGVFMDCISLKEIGLPEGLLHIKNNAFYNCANLANVYYSGTEEQWNNIEIGSYNGFLQGAIMHYNSFVPDVFSYLYIILDDGTIEITKYNGNDKSLRIPAVIDDKKVTSIGKQAFWYSQTLTNVSIPEGVTSIGESAFNNCRNLTNIDLPSGIKSIGSMAFYDCQNLLTCIIPSSVASIGESAFRGCAKLEKISLPAAITVIEESTFYECEGLKEVSLLHGITSIGKMAFSGCSNLAAIHLPASITSIGDDAFQSCESLTSISIPSGVTKIGFQTFGWCFSLKEVSIPSGVTDIGAQAFRNCRSLTSIDLPNGVKSIGDTAFAGCTGLKEINIPKSMEIIEKSAFQQCGSLTDVYYSGTPAEWSKINIFKTDNEELLNATIHYAESPVNPTEDYVYKDLNDDTVEITKYKGSGTAVKIPSQINGKPVVSIGTGAFNYLENLKEITIPSSVTKLGNNIFNHCMNLTAIYVDKDNSAFISENGVLFNKAKTELVRFPEGKGGSYEIDPGVIKIGISAFDNCTNLIEIQIPEGVREIGPVAFAGCTGITSLILPESIKAIGYNAFLSCQNLQQIQIPRGIKKIESSLFLHCSSLEKIELPDGVTEIGIYAFADCGNLKTITIPVSVVSIASRAFYAVGIPCKIEDVYYGGTREQWEQIDVSGTILGEENSISELLNLNAVIHFKENDFLSPEEIILPITADAKRELERLKSGDPFSLNQDFQHYLFDEQIDIMESYLYTWLAEINYTYQYSGASGVRERIMKKAGINPQGVFAFGMEQAVTHICVETKYGLKTFEITLDLGIPDHNGNLYPTYSAMYYEILEKESIPSDLPTSGQIGRESYADMGTFAECVRKASEDSLHGTYQWELLDEEMTAGVLVDKTVTEIIGNKNGSFSDAVFTIYSKPLFTYSKKVTIACPVDVHVYSMDGKEAGSIVGNKPDGGNANVRLDVNGDTKTVYLAGNDYYLNLRGTDTGTMRYEVEEIANEEVRRNVQFLELQLEKDMQYEGYVFRPLNIDRDLYALRTVGGSEQNVFYADKDTYQALFRRVQVLTLSQGQTSLDHDKTVQLNASLFPLDASNPNLQWTTDSESVVKVDDNGLVTAVGAGRAKVTVSTKDGSFLKQFCVIDVAEKNSGSGGSSSGNSSGGSTGGNSSGNSFGGEGSGSGSTSAVEQDKTPVVIKLHYVLQFHANGGTSLSRRTMTLLADDCPGIMPKVKRKDYIFDGWYTKQDGGEQVTGDKPLKEAATLYAQWTKAAAPAKAAAPTLKSVKKGQIQVSLKNVTGAAGYQITYSTNKKFSNAKIKEAGASAKRKTITGLKPGKKYYIRVRAYRVDSMGNRIYGDYSKAKSHTM